MIVAIKDAEDVKEALNKLSEKLDERKRMRMMVEAEVEAARAAAERDHLLSDEKKEAQSKKIDAENDSPYRVDISLVPAPSSTPAAERLIESFSDSESECDFTHSKTSPKKRAIIYDAPYAAASSSSPSSPSSPSSSSSVESCKKRAAAAPLERTRPWKSRPFVGNNGSNNLLPNINNPQVIREKIKQIRAKRAEICKNISSTRELCVFLEKQEKEVVEELDYWLLRKTVIDSAQEDESDEESASSCEDDEDYEPNEEEEEESDDEEEEGEEEEDDEKEGEEGEEEEEEGKIEVEDMSDEEEKEGEGEEEEDEEMEISGSGSEDDEEEEEEEDAEMVEEDEEEEEGEEKEKEKLPTTTKAKPQEKKAKSWISRVFGL